MPDDVRRWLQRDFFPLHLQRYSKSRRKAPIYWPLSTAVGQLHAVALLPQPDQPDALHRRQRLRRAQAQTGGADAPALRDKGAARTRDDEKQLEALRLSNWS